MIYDYFSRIQRKLEVIKWIIIEQSVNFDFVSDEMGIIAGKLVFIDKSILDFMELVSARETEYRFQYMDGKKNLISRWDSAPHHKEVRTFPYHLHTRKEVKESNKVNFIYILDTITDKVIENLKL
ncbi:hypothetical protein J4448_02120 [Candidatus Woesearchaeota archaeon]|nr:hypothetical protein [Candidatus Woesearchaeota archaeon]